jgi:peptidyl-dipeptidase A
MSTHDDPGHDAHGHGGGAHDAPAAAPPGKPTDWGTTRNVALLIAILAAVALMLTMVSCKEGARTREDEMHQSAARAEASRFLDHYTGTFQKLTAEANEAEWLTNTHIVEGDDTNAKRNDAAKKALAAWTGSVEVIETCRRLLKDKSQLEPLQARQLEMILYTAGDKPATAKELVDLRIAAETRQVEKLFGYAFKLDGQEVTTNQIDDLLKNETDLAKRQRAWEASKEVGRGLKDGLAELQRLRNGTVRGLGYSDYFAYKVSAFQMTTEEMLALNEKTLRELRPLYRELHTYWRYELAKRYGVKDVPDLIPAHWLPNRWSQDWNELMSVPGIDLNAALKDKSAEWVVKQAEKFYVSLGFEPLPPTFWTKSSLYPVPPGAGYHKNTHASAWHMDLDHDVRSLMSVEPNREWYETTHHELGHIYYYLSYSRPEIPIVLRDGANPAFHEGIGTMIGLAAMQPRFLGAVGLTPDSGVKPDPIQTLHQQALFYLVFAPWSSGVMTHFEYELYAKELPKEQWNKRWWELVAKYQGVAPPAARGEEYCDAATKTHINDTPAMYYSYALANVILMQIHEHIARDILHEDPHDTNYFGRKEVGNFLKSILSPGATVDWRKLMRDNLGQEISAEPMLRYFDPLMKWLQEQNRGRKATLPDV